MKNLDKINWGSILWLMICSIIGLIGYFTIKNPDVYQPWYAWILGSLLFETLMLAASILLGSLATSIFIKNYDDILKIAATGKKNNNKFGDTVANIFIIIFMISINIFMGVSLWNSWH